MLLEPTTTSKDYVKVSSLLTGRNKKPCKQGSVTSIYLPEALLANKVRVFCNVFYLDRTLLRGRMQLAT